MADYKECQTYVNTASDLCKRIHDLEHDIQNLTFEYITDQSAETRYKLDEAYKDLSIATDSLGIIMSRLEDIRRGLNFLMEAANANLQSADTTIRLADVVEEALDCKATDLNA